MNLPGTAVSDLGCETNTTQPIYSTVAWWKHRGREREREAGRASRCHGALTNLMGGADVTYGAVVAETLVAHALARPGRPYSACCAHKHGMPTGNHCYIVNDEIMMVEVS